MSDSAPRVPGRVWRSAGLLLAGRVWGSACTLAILWLLARPSALSPADFGRFTFWLAVFAVLDTLAEFGTGQVAVQRTAHDEGALADVLAAARRIRLRMGLFGLALVALGTIVSGERDAWWIVLAALYPVTHVLELSATVFRNKIAWGVPVLVRAFASGLSLAFVLTLLAADAHRPGLYVLGIAAGSATANFVLHASAARHLPRIRPESVPLRAVWRAAWPMGLAALCQQLYFWIDNLFVRAWCGDEALGHYNVAVRILSWSIALAIYATSTALPWLAREHVAGRLAPAALRLMTPLVALAVIGFAVAWPFADELLALFGADFVVAAPALRWLFGATVCVYAGAALLTAVVAAGRTGTVLAIAATALGVNLVGNTLLVPRLGIEGAAAATCLTEAVVTLLAAAFLLRGVRR